MNLHKDTHNHKHYSEQIAVFLSVLCTIHCVITPILVVILPAVGQYFEQYHWVENIIILSVFVLGTSAVLHGYKEHHHNKIPSFIFFFGLMILSASSFAKYIFNIENASLHFWSGLGGIIAGVGQLYNLKLSNSYKKNSK